MIPIEARKLYKSLDKKEILYGLDLEVPEGSVYGLLGRNGAGKTTLMKCLIGLFIKDLGDALVLGADLSQGCPPVKRDVGYVAEGEILPSWARIGHLITFEKGLRNVWEDQGLVRWLASEKLDLRRKVSTLSKGLRKRLELELVLAGGPRVLLMDEPLSGLDPVSRAEFLESFMGFVAEKKASVLFSSHILTDMERICDRVGILAKGKIAHETSMDALKEKGGRLEDVGVELIRAHDAREAVHA